MFSLLKPISTFTHLRAACTGAVDTYSVPPGQTSAGPSWLPWNKMETPYAVMVPTAEIMGCSPVDPTADYIQS